MTGRFEMLTMVALMLAACGQDKERPVSSPATSTVDLTQPLPPLDSEYPEPIASDTATEPADTVDTPADTVDTPADVPTAGDIQPIFNRACAGCHIGGSLGGLNLADAHAALVNVPAGQVASLDYVEPGDASRSYLWAKLNGTQVAAGGSGTQMPQTGSVTAEELNLIEAWIEGGALP